MTDARVADLLADVGLPADVDVALTGADPVLASPVAVGEGAAVAHGAAAAAAAALWRDRTGVDQAVRVDVGRAARSLLSFLFVRCGPPLDVDRGPGVLVSDLFATADGRWAHLHGGFPHLAQGTVDLLGCRLERDAVAAAVATWAAADLEDALAAAGLCGAVVRTAAEWDAHPQAVAIGDRGLVHVEKVADGPTVPVGDGARPLGGLRVLDLTRVLAGPTVGRTLAEHGAEVLLLNGPGRPNIDLFLADTGPGKRSARLDLATAEGRATGRALARDADVVVDGYRTGALAAVGMGADDLDVGVHVDVSCYGDVGPWAGRRGWEQMAESATGLVIAHSAGAPVPRCVPAAPCDYTTGVLGALGAMAALRRRAVEGGRYRVRVSLVATGRWLRDLRPPLDPATATGVPDARADLLVASTPWGHLAHLPPVASMAATPPAWALPSCPVGTHPPTWA